MKKQTKHTEPAKYIPPDGAIEALARCLFPAIQAYYESEEGQREFAKWQAQQTLSSEDNKKK